MKMFVLSFTNKMHFLKYLCVIVNTYCTGRQKDLNWNVLPPAIVEAQEV